ncbi:MAG: hypothetical protein IPH44_33670 [Myxococcales bacterium]|nr:hypothetical protein [Myxococcales bacterium]
MFGRDFDLEQLGVVEARQGALDLQLATLGLELAQPRGEPFDLAIVGAVAERRQRRLLALEASQAGGGPRGGEVLAPGIDRLLAPLGGGDVEELRGTWDDGDGARHQRIGLGEAGAVAPPRRQELVEDDDARHRRERREPRLQLGDGRDERVARREQPAVGIDGLVPGGERGRGRRPVGQPGPGRGQDPADRAELAEPICHRGYPFDGRHELRRPRGHDVRQPQAGERGADRAPRAPRGDAIADFSEQRRRQLGAGALGPHRCQLGAEPAARLPPTEHEDAIPGGTPAGQHRERRDQPGAGVERHRRVDVDQRRGARMDRIAGLAGRTQALGRGRRELRDGAEDRLITLVGARRTGGDRHIEGRARRGDLPTRGCSAAVSSSSRRSANCGTRSRPSIAGSAGAARWAAKVSSCPTERSKPGGVACSVVVRWVSAAVTCACRHGPPRLQRR